MTVEIAFKTAPGVELDRSLLVVGTPTLGLVGAISATHLVKALGMTPVGSVQSTAFPLFFVVQDGRPVPPVRLHALQTRCAAGLDCERLLVLTSEFPPLPSIQRAFADALMRWAKQRAIPMVLVPDGFPSTDEKPDELYGVASSDAGLKLLGALGVDILEGGLLAGFSAALLEAGLHHGIDVVCLLGEVDPALPDARAAATLVRRLAPALPELKLDVEELERAAEGIENEVKELRKRVAGQHSATAQPDLSMFS